MAFTIKKTKTYTWPCTISEPQDGGGFIDYKAPVKFKQISQERIDAAVREEADEGNTNVLDEVLIGWGDDVFKDESGTAIPYSEDNRREILSVPYVRLGILKGFFASNAGKKSKR